MGLKCRRLALVGITFVCFYSPGSLALDEPPESLSVENVTTTAVTNERTAMVVTIGTIRNNTDRVMRNPVVEVRYFDAEARLIDVIVENLYTTVIDANDDTAFRVQAFPAAPSESYVAERVRIIAADQAPTPCPDRRGQVSKPDDAEDNSPWWLDLIISAFPILLLVLVWIWIMRRYQGKKSVVGESVDEVRKQNQILGEQLKRIADAAERRDGR